MKTYLIVYGRPYGANQDIDLYTKMFLAEDDSGALEKAKDIYDNKGYGIYALVNVENDLWQQERKRRGYPSWPIEVVK